MQYCIYSIIWLCDQVNTQSLHTNIIFFFSLTRLPLCSNALSPVYFSHSLTHRTMVWTENVLFSSQFLLFLLFSLIRENPKLFSSLRDDACERVKFSQLNSATIHSFHFQWAIGHDSRSSSLTWLSIKSCCITLITEQQKIKWKFDFFANYY